MTQINVDHLELEKSGKRGDKPWHLFVVHGTYDDGTPLVNVKTFDSLPNGKVDVTLDPYESDAGRSYTAKLPRAAKGRTRRTVAAENGNGSANDSSDFEEDVIARLERIEKTLKALVAVYDPENVTP